MSCGTFTRSIVAAVVFALSYAIAPDAHAQALWDTRFFNPPAAAKPDDFLLPLPCGGSIAFRPVRTPPDDSDALADLSVQLGRAETQTGYIDYHRKEYLLGSLSRPDGNWYYLIGKFTITIDQWNAVISSGKCTPPSDEGMRPKADITWFEAVDYTRRLTEWLLRERKGALPRQEDDTSYLRLPTEVEWEFAARGGAIVDKAQFAEELSFPADDLSAYVVYREPGRERIARPVGSRKPNPLGLYDMLGNVEQWVIDPFHANRNGRDHGESGGLVTRGGSYETEDQGIRASLRSEYSPYDTRNGAAWHHPKIGFRLVVAAPVLSSRRRTDELRDSWIGIKDSGGLTKEGNEVVAKLDRLTSDVKDTTLRAGLESLQHEVLVERGRRDEVESRLFRTVLRYGALLVRSLLQDTQLVTVLQSRSPYAQQQLDAARSANDEVRIQQYTQLLNAFTVQHGQAVQRRDFAARGYTDAIVQLANDTRVNQQEAQRDLLAQELGSSGLADLVPYLRRFDLALTVYRARPEIGKDALVRLITDDTVGIK